MCARRFGGLRPPRVTPRSGDRAVVHWRRPSPAPIARPPAATAQSKSLPGKIPSKPPAAPERSRARRRRRRNGCRRPARRDRPAAPARALSWRQSSKPAQSAAPAPSAESRAPAIAPGHRKGDAMHEQGIDEEACGQPPPPLPSLCVPMHACLSVGEAYRRGPGASNRISYGSHDLGRVTVARRAHKYEVVRSCPRPPKLAEPTHGTQASPTRPTDQNPRLPGRGRTRPRGQSPSRHRLRRPLHIPGIHLDVPGDRPARLRHRRDRLPAAALPHRVEIAQALPQ